MKVKLTIPSRTRRLLSRLFSAVGSVMLLIGIACCGWYALNYFQAWSYQVTEETRLAETPKAYRGPRESIPRIISKGSFVGELTVPRLGLKSVVLEGAGAGELKLGVGHIPGTALPGEPGNVSLAAHRDTCFRALRLIRRNDLIKLTTFWGSCRYRVDWTKVVTPEDTGVLKAGDRPTLTLVTCYPFYMIGSAPDRFIVRAHQIFPDPDKPVSNRTNSAPERRAFVLGQSKYPPADNSLIPAAIDGRPRGRICQTKAGTAMPKGRTAATIIAWILIAGTASAQPDLLRRGISLMNASRPLEAEQILRSVPGSSPDFKSAQVLLGYLYLQRSALSEAEGTFQRVLQADEESTQARLGLGIALLRRGLAHQAALELEKIITDPSLGESARIQWIQSLFVMGKEDEALRQAKDLAIRFPSVAEFQNLLAFLYQVKGEVRPALRALKRSFELDPGNLSTCMTLFSLSRQSGDSIGALAWVERGLQIDPNHPLLYQDLAEISRHLGRKEAAEAAELEARKTYEAEILYTRAVNLRASGRAGEALEALRQCVHANPRLSKGWEDLGELLYRDGKMDEARRAFQEAVKADPESSRGYLGVASVLRAEGREAEALQYYRKASSGGLDAPDILSGMAAALLEEGKAQEAAAAMLRAIRRLPDDPDLLAYLGRLEQAAGHEKEALAAFTDALSLDPKQVTALLGRARSTLSEGHENKSAALYRQVLKFEPANAEAWRGLIQAQRKGGDASSAEASCRSCLKLLPRDIECREQLASLRLQKGDYREAAAQFQHLLRNGSASKDILDGLAFSLMEEGNIAQAIELLEGSAKRFGEDAWVYSNLGFLYRSRGNLAAAVACYRRAHQLAPGDPEISQDLGLVLYLSKEYEAAVEALLSALQKRPSWGLAHFNLAMTYWNLGQYAMALHHARLADEQGVREAHPVVEALTNSLSLEPPGIVTVRRRGRP